MIRRYEVTLNEETFVITKDDNSLDTYNIFLVTTNGLTQNENEFTENTQKYINEIFDNLDKYAVKENEINPDYRY